MLGGNIDVNQLIGDRPSFVLAHLYSSVSLRLRRSTGGFRETAVVSVLFLV